MVLCDMVMEGPQLGQEGLRGWADAIAPPEEARTQRQTFLAELSREDDKLIESKLELTPRETFQAVVGGLCRAGLYRDLIPSDASERDPRFRAFVRLLARDWAWLEKSFQEVRRAVLAQALDVANSRTFVFAAAALAPRLGMGELSGFLERLEKCPEALLRAHKRHILAAAELFAFQAWNMASVDQNVRLPRPEAVRAAQLIIARVCGCARHSVGSRALGRIYVHAQAVYAPDGVFDESALGNALADSCRAQEFKMRRVAQRDGMPAPVLSALCLKDKQTLLGNTPFRFTTVKFYLRRDDPASFFLSNFLRAGRGRGPGIERRDPLAG